MTCLGATSKLLCRQYGFYAHGHGKEKIWEIITFSLLVNGKIHFALSQRQLLTFRTRRYIYIYVYVSVGCMSSLREHLLAVQNLITDRVAIGWMSPLTEQLLAGCHH